MNKFTGNIEYLSDPERGTWTPAEAENDRLTEHDTAEEAREEAEWIWSSSELSKEFKERIEVIEIEASRMNQDEIDDFIEQQKRGEKK